VENNSLSKDKIFDINPMMKMGVVDENGDPLKGGGGIAKGGKPIKLEGGFYSADGMKISQSYYDRLWSQGRSAPFLQAKEILNSNPKIIPDPRGAPGYFKYESSGLEMIYNPTTGQIGHIQPIKKK
jgi:filamentous hemagglutinin